MSKTVDIVSDLHIDYWSQELKHNIKFDFSSTKNHPLKWENKNIFNKLLIVAGDISDNLDLSIKELDKISKFYDKVLFVDGNHEHYHIYPNLHSLDDIYSKIKSLNNNKIKYLPKETFKFGKIAFIGYCGWWNFNNKKAEETKKHIKFFKENYPEFKEEQNIINTEYIYNRSIEEYNLLTERLKELEKDGNIEEIIIVTHTLPRAFFSQGYLESEFNTEFSNINKQNYPKLSKWIFGHTHAIHETKLLEPGIQFISNPRGRPDDYNRINYQIRYSNL